MSLLHAIIEYSHREQLEVVGVIDAQPLEHLRVLFGRHGENNLFSPFSKGTVEEKINPQFNLKGCKSIICLALSYLAPSFSPVPPFPDKLRGLVSRSAQGIDYHAVLEKKAKKLVSLLHSCSMRPFQYHIQIDRGPLAERSFAEKAGGRTGMNTLYISPVSGSWVSLALILTDMEIPPWSAPVPANIDCHSCRKCVEACPTGALTPFRIDPYRCLSFISQSKGTVPLSFRKALGSRLFGCDTCQEVCPHNLEASPLSEPLFFPFPENPLLLPVIAMTPAEYRLTVGLTSAAWRGRRTIQRNAVIALGNSGDRSAVPPLIRLLNSDPRPEIRLHTAWALGSLGGRPARRALETAREKEKDMETLAEITGALEGI